ncbi:MAG: YgiQ family radical SAM protein [Clostridia bacterium]|nr:YgiQ family radical SAM protein [Clostridia bacterium]
MQFLPITREEVAAAGWDAVDFVFVTGDAYVDHPSFGTAILSRLLESEGYRVAILAQPSFQNNDPSDFRRFGKPRLGFLINAGNIDSMVAHYTAAKRKRSDDAYSPGGKAGRRPDRAVTVYSRLAKAAYPDVPVIIGGLEASLRRFAHYDYWADMVLPSILEDSGADLLSFGMGERQTLEIASRLRDGTPVQSLIDIKGTCYMADSIEGLKGIRLPSYAQCAESKTAYAEACRIEYDEHDAVRGKKLFQPHGNRFLVQNEPMPPLTTPELDRVYALPYARYYHPSYEKQGGVPAIAEVEFSLTHNRGCFGACNFCSIAFHQGRQISCRSEQSILDEAKKLTKNPHFKGYIHDVGGPTANFRRTSCDKQLQYGLCKGKKCLAPEPCKQLQVDHSAYTDLLRKIRAIPGIKKVFIRSGIRFDYLMADPSDTFFKELVAHHVSGQLKVAPEHCSAYVLDKMGKPHIESYLRFAKRFYKYTKQIGKEQYLVPYLMSSHPGCRLKDAVELALFLKREHIRPEQVQDFYPTPGTLSTCMYYTELDPYTLKPIHVPKSAEDKAMQRALLQYFRKENYEKVYKALTLAGRRDLIGTGPDCLLRPKPGSRLPQSKQKAKRRPQIHKWDGKTGRKR